MPNLPWWYWLVAMGVSSLLLATRSGRRGLRHARNGCTGRTYEYGTLAVVFLAVLAGAGWPMVLFQGALVLVFRVLAAATRLLAPLADPAQMHPNPPIC
jgi:hypothetical protein